MHEIVRVDYKTLGYRELGTVNVRCQHMLRI